MSVKAMSYVWETPYKGAKKLMLLAIADRCDDEGTCYPGVTKLSEKCSIKTRAAQALITELENCGEIVVQIGTGIETGHGKTNRYYMKKYRASIGLSTPVHGTRIQQITPRDQGMSNPASLYDGMQNSASQGMSNPASQGMQNFAFNTSGDSSVDSSVKETTLSAATQQSAVSSQSANQWPDGVHSPFPIEGETEIPAPAENVEMGEADATTALSPHSAPPPFPQWAVKDPSFNEFSADRSLVCLWNARASIMVCIPVGSIAETEGGSVAYVFKKTSGQDALEQTTHLFLLNAVKKWHSSILQLQNRSVALVFEILGQEEKFWSVVMGLMEGASRSANGFAFSTSLLINQRTIWAGTATIAELTTTTTPSLTLTVSYLDTWGVNTLEEISESFAQTVIGAARTTSKAGKKPSNERTPQPPVPAAEGKSKRKTPAPNRMGLILDKAWRKSVSNFLLPQLMGNASKPDRKPYNISPACSEAELWAFGNWWRSNHPAHIQVPTRANAVYDAIMGFRGEEDYESRVSDAEYDVSKMFPREGVAPVETPTAAPASPEQLAEVSANLTKLMESFRQENVS